MFFEQSLEEKIKSNEKRIKELQNETQRINQTFEQLYQEQGVTYEQMQAYFSNNDNFSPEELETMNLLLAEQEKKTESIDNKIVNPLETKQRYEEKSFVDPRWLFIR